MRPRAVGGWEPDEKEQHELINLYHLARTAGHHTKDERRTYAINEFMRTHANEPHVVYKWIYVWLLANTQILVPQ